MRDCDAATHIRPLYLHIANQWTPVELHDNMLGGLGNPSVSCAFSQSATLLHCKVDHFAVFAHVPLNYLL